MICLGLQAQLARCGACALVVYGAGKAASFGGCESMAHTFFSPPLSICSGGKATASRSRQSNVQLVRTGARGPMHPSIASPGGTAFKMHDSMRRHSHCRCADTTGLCPNLHEPAPGPLAAVTTGRRSGAQQGVHAHRARASATPYEALHNSVQQRWVQHARRGRKRETPGRCLLHACHRDAKSMLR